MTLKNASIENAQTLLVELVKSGAIQLPRSSHPENPENSRKGAEAAVTYLTTLYRGLATMYGSEVK